MPEVGTSVEAEAATGAGDPLARRLFALLRDRPEVDRRLVFEALAERVGVGGLGLGEERRLAVEALEACRADRGGELPTVAAYRAWRERAPGGRLAPSVGSLRRLFGSWGEAVAAMPSAPRFDPTLGRLAGRGRRIDRERALDGLRAFAASLADGERPTTVRYRAWASARPAGAPRVPAGARTHVKLFGSWLGALTAAGVAYPPRDPDAPRQRRRGFVPADAVDALRRFWQQCGPPATSPRYERWAGSLGPGERVPSPATITALMGGWRAAVVEAIGAGASGPSRGPSFARAELLAALRECRAQLGRPPSVTDYSAWRARQPARRPSARTIAVWLGAGAWPAAVAAAQREGGGR